MNLWGAAAWGLAGGLSVEALALYSLNKKIQTMDLARANPAGTTGLT